MRTGRHTAEQIVAKLRQAEVELARGQSIAQVSKHLGITEQTYYRWRKEFGGLRLDQAKLPGQVGAHLDHHDVATHAPGPFRHARVQLVEVLRELRIQVGAIGGPMRRVVARRGWAWLLLPGRAAAHAAILPGQPQARITTRPFRSMRLPWESSPEPRFLLGIAARPPYSGA